MNEYTAVDDISSDGYDPKPRPRPKDPVPELMDDILGKFCDLRGVVTRTRIAEALFYDPEHRVFMEAWGCLVEKGEIVPGDEDAWKLKDG